MDQPIIEQSDSRPYKTSQIVAIAIGLLLLLVVTIIILSLIPLYLPEKSVTISSGKRSLILVLFIS